jgi:hypothetical protein
VKDYLFGKVSDKVFPSGKEAVYHMVFLRSLQVMSRTLQRDIYNLHAPGFLIDQIKEPEPDPLAAVQYSCIYWVDYLCACIRNAGRNDNLREGGVVDNFMRNKYLYWLEALSLCKTMSEGVVSISKLEALVEVMHR